MTDHMMTHFAVIYSAISLSSIPKKLSTRGREQIIEWNYRIVELQNYWIVELRQTKIETHRDQETKQRNNIRNIIWAAKWFDSKECQDVCQ